MKNKFLILLYGSSVVCMFYLANIEVTANPIKTTRPTATVIKDSFSDSFDKVISDTIKAGGVLVQCVNNSCYSTHDFVSVGSGKDGYYVLFPTETKFSKKKIKELSDRVKELSNR